MRWSKEERGPSSQGKMGVARFTLGDFLVVELIPY